MNTTSESQDKLIETEFRPLSKVQTGQNSCSDLLYFDFSIGKYRKIIFLVSIILLIDQIQAKEQCEKFGVCQICLGQSYSTYGGPFYYIEKCTYEGVQQESKCYQKCCGFVYESNKQGIQKYKSQCDDEKQSTPTFVIIIICVAPAIIILCSSLFIISICFLCRSKLNNQDDIVGQQQPQSDENFAVEQNLQIKLSQLENKKDIKYFLLNTNQVCCICLEKQTELMTNCKHFFHLNCFAEWINKNKRCPYCNAKERNFNPLTIYCKKCNYRVLDVKIGGNKQISQLLMSKYSDIVCAACKQ